MTLILTCLTHQHIIQVADRRLTRSDGSLFSDDTNKAVFFCGKAAVAYTGLAQIEGRDTAQWIALCMRDESQIEPAMMRTARNAEIILGRAPDLDKRLAIIATGWATLQGGPIVRPYILVASNFLDENWKWKLAADKTMVVRTVLLDVNYPYHLFAAGQNLNKKEHIQLHRDVRRAAEHGAMTSALIRILVEKLQRIARSTDARGKRVGKGMIIQLLSRRALDAGQGRLVTPLTPDTHSYLYVSKDGRTDPSYGPVVVCGGTVLSGLTAATIPPGGKSIFTK